MGKWSAQLRRSCHQSRPWLTWRRWWWCRGCLSGGEAGGGDPERRAGHIVQPQGVAEPDRVGVAAVLAADPQLQRRPGLAALSGGDLHEAAHPSHIDGHKRIRRDELAFLVQAQELADVVAGEPKGGLGEVVGAKGEELGHLGDLAGDQGRPGQLDHRPPPTSSPPGRRPPGSGGPRAPAPRAPGPAPRGSRPAGS